MADSVGYAAGIPVALAGNFTPTCANSLPNSLALKVPLTAARLAEHQTFVWEFVVGSKPDQHSGLKITEENVLPL